MALRRPPVPRLLLSANSPEAQQPYEEDTHAEVPSEDGRPFSPIALPRDRNPLLVYVGGLDEASQPTMASTARLIVETLTVGRIKDPTCFPWQALTYAVVKRLRSRLRAKGLAPRTINKALTMVRATARESWMLGLSSRETYDRINEVENLKSVRLPVGRVVEQDEIAKLMLACCLKGTDRGLRDAGFFALMRGAGLREREATLVKREDYDQETGTINVRHGKHHKQRLAYVEPAFEIVLKRLLRRLPDLPREAPLLPRLSPSGRFMDPPLHVTTQSVSKLVSRWGQKAGVAPFTPHDLRRSFITLQLEAGVDPLRLARAVGHANPATTLLYDRRTAASDRRAIRKEPVDEATLKREVDFRTVAERLWGLDVEKKEEK